MLVSHDDLKTGLIEPLEMSNNINQFVPIEFLLSLIYLVLSVLASPWYLTILIIPLVIFNLMRYARKEHRIYFITRKEYQTHFHKFDIQFKVKTGYYSILLAVSLVMLVLSLIDFLSNKIH